MALDADMGCVRQLLGQVLDFVCSSILGTLSNVKNGLMRETRARTFQAGNKRRGTRRV